MVQFKPESQTLDLTYSEAVQAHTGIFKHLEPQTIDFDQRRRVLGALFTYKFDQGVDLLRGTITRETAPYLSVPVSDSELILRGLVAYREALDQAARPLPSDSAALRAREFSQLEVSIAVLTELQTERA